MKVLVISENIKLLEQISLFPTFRQKGITLTTLRSNLLNSSQRIANEVPDIVILDIANAKMNEFELTERFKSQYKNMAFMMMSEDTSAEILLKAIRSGISEVISLPVSEPSLVHAIERHQLKLNTNASQHCKVISVMSCKGGSGATFIATNLGYILSEAYDKKVLLIDLNQYFGDASMYVSEQKPSMSLSDVCAQINRLDISFLESSLVQVTPKYKILAAAENPANAVDILPEHIETLLRIARNYYDVILLDVGRQIDVLTVKGLDLSDSIYPVVQLVLPYIRDAKNLLDIFKSLGYSNNKVHLIVNRYEKTNQLKLTDLNNTLSANIIATIPNHYSAVTDSVNQGVPVYRFAKSSPVTKALVLLAEKITGVALPEKGLMASLFSKK